MNKENNMANLDKLRKEAADIKKDAAAKNTDKLPDYILKLYDEYYYSYVNNDMARFHAAADNVEDAITVAYGQYNNVNNYINYCKASILTKIMTALFNRDVELKLPDANVPIDVTMANIDDRVLKVLTEAIERRYLQDEEEKLKRYEEYFREMNKKALDTDEYFKQLELDMMEEGDYVKHLIRPDADADFINANRNILAAILTDEGMAVINHYTQGGCDG